MVQLLHINCVHTIQRKYNRHPSEQNKFKLKTNEKLLQTAKANYESSLISSFSFNNSKIYKCICSLTKSNPIPCSVHYNFISADSDLAKASLFNEYFYSVFTKSPNHPSPPDVIDHPSMITELNISDGELLSVLLYLDTTKTMGYDGILPIVLQRCALALYQPLSYPFNFTLQFPYLPSY